MSKLSLTAPLLGSGGTSITAGRPKARASFGSPPYEAASGTSQELAGFNPSLRSADSEALPARDKVAARARALYRNNAWVNGGIDKRVGAVVGSKIWLRAKPDFAAMGMSAEWADEWARQAESLFRLWANSIGNFCDVERQQSFGGMVEMAYRHYLVDGEACAAMYMLPRGRMVDTAMLVVDPDRLANPDGRPDSRTLRGGVQLDQYGAAIGYWIRNAHVQDVESSSESTRFTYVPRETRSGRPMFVHVFNKTRAHMHRGISRLAAAMTRMKMLDTADKAELAQMVLDATFGLYAKTQRSSADVARSLAPVGDDDEGGSYDDARADFYAKSDIKLNGVRIAVLPDGDEIETIETKRSGSNYQTFERLFLNSYAATIGQSGEQVSNDWQGINYSNARTLLNEIYRDVENDRHRFTHGFCGQPYACLVEEWIARDLLECPGGKHMFYVFRDALCQAEWIGPGRGYIDPKKEWEATDGRISSFLSNLPDEAAEQGRDFRDNLWNAKRVQKEMERYGLEVRASTSGTGNAGGGNDDDDPDAADRRENEQSRRGE